MKEIDYQKLWFRLKNRIHDIAKSTWGKNELINLMTEMLDEELKKG